MAFPASRFAGRNRTYSAILAQKSHEPREASASDQQRLRHAPRVLSDTSDNANAFDLFTPELMTLRRNILTLLGSAHKGLSENADKFYFLHPSHQLRPLIVLLFSRATNGLGGEWAAARWQADSEPTVPGLTTELDGPLARAGVLIEHNLNMPDDTDSFEDVFSLREPEHRRQPVSIPPSYVKGLPALGFLQEILPTQLRLAHIVEMINLASLLHEEVTNSTSPSSNASNPVIPTKLAVLGGDFLLGRASTALSRLGKSEVVELVASVISNIVEGRVARNEKLSMSLSQAWEYYMRKTYLETASLLAKGARAAVLLGGSGEGEAWNELAYGFGRNLGIAHQLAKDAAFFKSGYKCSQITAPLLYAWEEHPEIASAIENGMQGPADAEMTRYCIEHSSSLDRTSELAHTYTERARDCLQQLPESESRYALEVLCDQVLHRTWATS